MRIVPISSAQRPPVAPPPSNEKLLFLSNGDGDDDDSSYYCAVPSSGTGDGDEADEQQFSSKSTATARSSTRRRGVQRWLYNSPRLGFLLVLVCCTCLTGVYASYYLTKTLLMATGANDALANARSQVFATEVALRKTTTCVREQTLVEAIESKAAYELEYNQWKVQVQTKSTQLDDAQSKLLATCVDTSIETLANQVMGNRTASHEQQQLTCLESGIQELVDQYGHDSYKGVAPPALAPRIHKLKQIAKSISTQLLVAKQATQSLDGIQVQVSFLASNMTNGIVSLLDAWLEQLTNAVVVDLGTFANDTQLPSVQLLVVPANQFPVRFGGDAGPGDSNSPLFAFQNQLLDFLRKAIGADQDLSVALDQIQQTWTEMEDSMVQMEHHASLVRQELDATVNTTQVHIQKSINALTHAVGKLRDEIATKIQVSMASFASQVVELVTTTQAHNSMEDVLVLDAYGGQEPPPWVERAVDPTTRFHALDGAIQALQPTTLEATASPPTMDHPRIHWDAWVFRSSLLDASALVVSVVLTWDFLRRMGWFAQKCAALFTESYSDLPSVDVRDITSITTLLDLWGVLKGKHDWGDVLYTLLTDGGYVLETAVHFVLWVLLEICGTLAMVKWKQSYLARCRHPGRGAGKNQDQESSGLSRTLLLDAGLRQWLEYFIEGKPSDTMKSPLETLNIGTKTLGDAFALDLSHWHAQIQDVAQRQTTQANQLTQIQEFFKQLDATGKNCSAAIGPGDDMETDGSSITGCLLDYGNGPADTEATWDRIGKDTASVSTSSVASWRDAISTACFPPPRSPLSHSKSPTGHHHSQVVSSFDIVARLEVTHRCAVDQTLYLSMASWWMFLVVALALRLIARMTIKSFGMMWWRFLGNDQLQFLAFCDEKGVFHTPQRLPKAVRRHLRNIKWRVRARMVGVLMGIASVVVVASLVLPKSMMMPLK